MLYVYIHPDNAHRSPSRIIQIACWAAHFFCTISYAICIAPTISNNSSRSNQLQSISIPSKLCEFKMECSLRQSHGHLVAQDVVLSQTELRRSQNVYKGQRWLANLSPGRFNTTQTSFFQASQMEKVWEIATSPIRVGQARHISPFSKPCLGWTSEMWGPSKSPECPEGPFVICFRVPSAKLLHA